MRSKSSILIFLCIFFFFGTGISILIYKNFRDCEKQIVFEKFDNRINTFVYALNERYLRNKVVIQSMEGFFSALEYVSGDEWKRYFNSIDLAGSFPALTWIGYVKRIHADKKDAFLQIYQEKEGKPFKIWPEGTFKEYFPIVYIGPQQFRNLIGYNFFSNPDQQKSLQESIIKNEIQSTDSISTATTKKPKNSERLLCYPISKTVVDRRKVLGWVITSIDFSVLIEQVTKQISLEGIDIEVFRGEKQDSSTLFFQKGLTSETKALLSKKDVLELAGVKWTFVFKSNQNFEEKSIGIYPLLLFFILLASLLGFFLFIYFRLRPILSAGDTNRAQSILSSMQYATIATNLAGKITYINPAAEKLLGYDRDEVVGKMTPEAFHDPDEIKQRAEELAKTLNRPIQPNFEVFVALAQKETPENRSWSYVKKDKSKVTVQLSVTTLKDLSKQIVGYLGVAIDVTQLKI